MIMCSLATNKNFKKLEVHFRLYLYNNLVPSVCLYVCFRFKMADRAVVFSSRLVRTFILDWTSVVAAAVNAD